MNSKVLVSALVIVSTQLHDRDKRGCVCLKARVEEVVDWAWGVFQPLLFGLIGAEIRASELEGNTVGETQ